MDLTIIIIGERSSGNAALTQVNEQGKSANSRQARRSNFNEKLPWLSSSETVANWLVLLTPLARAQVRDPIDA